MAPLVKLAIVPKMSEEASLLGKSALYNKPFYIKRKLIL